MSRASRSYSQSGVYHILFRGVNQQSIFEEKADYAKLKETILIVKEEMSFEIYAYCFMSNHVHIVLKEKTDKDISLIMKRKAIWGRTFFGTFIPKEKTLCVSA